MLPSELNEYLKRSTVVSATGDMLQVLILQCNLMQVKMPLTQDGMRSLNPIVFLCAYMITRTSRPPLLARKQGGGNHQENITRVLSAEEERTLLEASEATIKLVHSIAKGLQEGKSWTELAPLTQPMPGVFTRYFNLFGAWEERAARAVRDAEASDKAAAGAGASKRMREL